MVNCSIPTFALNSICIFLIVSVSIPPLFSPALALYNHPDHAREMLFDEKSRLGSMPPSCYNKCNQCHPCTAVQVSTLPSLHRVQPPVSSLGLEFESASWDGNRYSNYKPLGWKCRCKDHFYNP